MHKLVEFEDDYNVCFQLDLTNTTISAMGQGRSIKFEPQKMTCEDIDAAVSFFKKLRRQRKSKRRRK